VRAAIVTELGKSPERGEAPEPEAGEGEVVLEVLASSLNPIDIAVAAGRFYGGHPPVPYVAGAEAVGRVAGDGGLVWAAGSGIGVARDGALAERAAVPEASLTPVPEGAEPELAVALGIAGMAGWLPLAWRAPVRDGETVLVLGATGTAGLVAVQAARLLGAGRVVAAGRDPERLARAAEVGADETVRIGQTRDLARAFRRACGGDGPTLVFDPLWGEPLVAALEAAAPGARVVNVGQSAGAEATIRSGFVRGKQLDLLGYSNFAAPRDVVREEYGRLVQYALAGEIRVDVERVRLDDVPEAWERQAAGADAKLVVVP
jgi:NADPH2:quinone reductase